MTRLGGSILLALASVLGCSASADSKVVLGNEHLLQEKLELLHGKRVGLIVNHTARLSNGQFLVDALLDHGVTITALFGPEHGIRGEAAAGERIADSIDEKTGIAVYSLYGTTRKPTPAMLETVDILIYDIQDVGVRFYTYISTMGLCMEAAAEKGIPFIVLDRPNPLGGLTVDGPMLEVSQKSFVGMYPIPVVYGLTCGELARMINAKQWLANGRRCNLIVIEMKGWQRRMLWQDTGLEWTPPSPNIRTAEAALVYPATCFIEATNVSEGRGTSHPFQFIGAPFVDRRRLVRSLQSTSAGVRLTDTTFSPHSSKFAGTPCYGIFIVPGDKVVPFSFAVELLRALKNASAGSFEIKESSLLRLAGSTDAVTHILSGNIHSSYFERISDELGRFREESLKYHLYH